MIATGRTVGKYRILDRIGRGGMGTVYRALDDTLQREVAIKVLNAELAGADGLKRFRTEALTLARLQHPAIATLFELFEEDGDLLMVMEFVRGETLQKLAERMVRVPPDFAAQLCSQALDGLAHAHRAGIIHRDLKPGNLMVTDEGLVKVMDFGIARVAGAEHLTSAGFSMGTPAYMAPEQVLGQETDARADLYAMGVVLYRLWTGRLPFEGDTPFAVAHKQLHEMPTPLNVACPDLPAWCDAILARALAKDPAERFQTAAEFKAALAASARFLPLEDEKTVTMPTPQALLLGTSSLGTSPRSYQATPAGLPVSGGTVVPTTAGTTAVAAPRALTILAIVAVVVAVVAVGTAVVVYQRSSAPSSAAAVPVQADRSAERSAVVPPAPPSTDGAQPEQPTRPASKVPRPAAFAASGAASSAVPRPAAPSDSPGPFPALTFKDVKLVVVQKDKAREEDADVQLADGRVTIHGPAGRVAGSFPYTSVLSVSSARARQPRWRAADGTIHEAKLSGGPLGFLKSDRNWVGLVTMKAVYVFRVGDGALVPLTDAVVQRTGAKVVRLAK